MKKCLLCSKSDLVIKRLRIQKFNLLFCQRCGLGFLDYQPSPQEIKSLYNKDHLKTPKKGYFNYFSLEPGIRKMAQIENRVYSKTLKVRNR